MPHNFPSLIDGPAQAVLIAGTGLSTPHAPTVKELKVALDKVALGLGVIPDGDFYDLAEAVLNRLLEDGKSDPESRLWLAEKLEILDDRRWFGEIGLPLSGNTPRHRAIARFSVEKRLRAIVSLNWDTLLEAALESVGLGEGPRSPRPWEITGHAKVVDNTDSPRLASRHQFPVIKPHGCVRKLEQARRQFRLTGNVPRFTFKLTRSEIGGITPLQSIIDEKVKVLISECPLIAVGWKAAEEYLRDTIVDIARAVLHPALDAFTLVDLFWNSNHTEIADAYRKNNGNAFVEVKADTPPTTDCMFQWLQARYALRQLIAVSPAPQQATLEQLLHQLDQPGCDHPILEWVDCWLPTWGRMCWRAGVVEGTDPYTGRPIEPWEIPIMPRDVHVPLGGMSLRRRDLQAAAKLLVVLGSTLGQFKFDRYPGGFWDGDNRCLYLPLPVWRGAAQPSDLAAIKPLTEELRSLGFVQYIRLVWLDSEDTAPDEANLAHLAAQVRGLMPLSNFATVDALSWVDLEALRGGR